MVAIVNCNTDSILISLPFGEGRNFGMHKLDLGLMIVVIDIVSVLACHYMFSTLRNMNEDFIEIMDKHVIKKSSFVTTIKHLRMDKHTRDLRILRMKLWLHFNRVLAQQKQNIEIGIKSENQYHEEDVDPVILDSYTVADIQFSKSDQEKY